MADEADPAALEIYKRTLGFWRYNGYILWKRVAGEWLDKELSGYTTTAINELMYLHVAGGGTVQQVVERRPEYLAARYHYDFRLPISGRRIYVETVLIEDDEPDPTIRVVSIHDA